MLKPEKVVTLTEVKYCVECKHFRNSEFGPELGRCSNGIVNYTANRNIDPGSFVKAYYARIPSGACGTEARYFEPKTAPFSLWGRFKCWLWEILS